MFSQCAVIVATFTLSPIKDGLQCNSVERAVVGDLYRRHRGDASRLE